MLSHRGARSRPCHAIAAHTAGGFGHGRVMRPVVGMLLVAGCGTDGIAIEDYADAQRASQCRYYVQCGIISDLETCDQTNIGWYFTSPQLIEAVHAGTVKWDGEAAARCLEQDVSCDLTSDAHRLYCAPITAGTLHDGETCQLGSECISKECWTEPCVGLCCEGYCVGDTAPVPGHIGDVCRYSICQEGYCDDSVCVPRLPAGAPCDGAFCDDGLACRYDTTGMRRCVELPSTGERCYSDNCAIDGERCTANNVCERGGLLWEPCLQDRDCARLYRCGSEMRCVDGGAGLGEPCFGVSTPGLRCADLDAYCDGSTHKCELRYPLVVPDCDLGPL